ncbi:MAG: hypothetical protein RJQ00_05915 [Vicingaceae bacterium]
MEKTEFRRLKLKQKYALLNKEGKYLAARTHGGFQCSLYDLNGYYVEVWKPIGINIIQWIEVVNRDEIIDSYLEHFKIK